MSKILCLQSLCTVCVSFLSEKGIRNSSQQDIECNNLKEATEFRVVYLSPLFSVDSYAAHSLFAEVSR